ncbi:putative DNA oxidative demethylase [Helianthus annuus]|nr:putative DNA oxidative demethylase [Helianthus annuus]
MCDKWGVEPGGFYEPYYIKGEEYRIHMCFGLGCDPKTPPVPQQLISLAAKAVKDAQPHLDQLPSMSPNTCLVCFYPLSCGRIGLHQDRGDESGRQSSRVVSIFIGEAAEFVYRLCGDNNKLRSVLMKSGDVLIYGGRSRHIYHGVTQNMPLLLLQETGIKAGCLNLTLTQF